MRNDSLHSPEVSIVVPVLNEAETIDIFLASVIPLLEAAQIDGYEIIFVDDGSKDGTPNVVRSASASNSCVKLVQLSRNFGKEAAMTAGLSFSSGRASIPMDVDLQDPPELILDFIRLWRQGYDTVYGQRIDRGVDTGAKRSSANMFYTIFNLMAERKIEENVGDYRLMSRRVVDATLELRERNRFMKGLFAWVGYESIAVPYKRRPRIAGTSKFNYWRLWNFALDGITSFSTIPLKIWTYVGAIVALGAVLFTVVIILRTLISGREVPGYASLMVVVLLLGAVQLVSLGVIGEYLGRLYMESKKRPIFLVQSTVGFFNKRHSDLEVESSANEPFVDRIKK